MNAMTTTEKAGSFLVPEERAILMIEACANEIFKATTIKDVERSISYSEAVAAWVRASEANDRIKRDAEFLRVRAERRLGEIALTIPSRHRGSQPRPLTTQDRAIKNATLAGKSNAQVAREFGVAPTTVANVLRRHDRCPSPTIPRKEDVLKEHGISLLRACIAQNLAKAPAETFEAALSSARSPTVTAVAQALNEMGVAPVNTLRKAHQHLAEEAISLLDACCKAKRAPRRDEVNALELKLAALNVTK